MADSNPHITHRKPRRTRFQAIGVVYLLVQLPRRDLLDRVHNQVIHSSNSSVILNGRAAVFLICTPRDAPVRHSLHPLSRVYPLRSCLVDMVPRRHLLLLAIRILRHHPGTNLGLVGMPGLVRGMGVLVMVLIRGMLDLPRGSSNSNRGIGACHLV